MTIQSLLTDESRLNQMSKASFELGKPNATDTIVDEAMGLIRKEVKKTRSFIIRYLEYFLQDHAK